jgi:dihydrodiol dehydrogenase / D-xylose 1-dehydrogenase (NADP)
MTKKGVIRWGILGCGLIAHAFAEGLKKVPDAKLGAVASKSGKADAFGSKYNVNKRYNNYEQLVKDSDVDIIYVATTHNFHFENMLLCLDYEKPVLSEKPFTINALQADQLIQKAKRRSIFMMEGMWTRFLPCVVRLRKMIHSERILGEIRHFKADFCVNLPYGNEHRVFNPHLAGGALLDIGVYPISFSSMIMKQSPQKITSGAIMGETGVDIFSNYFFSYKNGSTSMMTSSNTFTMPHDAYIIGTEGFMHIPDFSHPTSIFLHLNKENTKIIEIPFESTGFQFEAIEAGKCLKMGKIESNILPLDETLQIMNTMDTLRAQWGLKYPDEREEFD